MESPLRPLVPPESSPCPRCSGALRKGSLGATPIVECSRCAGFWLAQEELARLCSEASKEARPGSEPRRGRAASLERVTYLPCPVCRQLMQRKSFAIGSGVVLDRCVQHGVWLDRGELEIVLEFVRSGGLEHAAQRAREERIAPQEGAPPRPLASSARRRGRQTPREGFASSLFEVVLWLGLDLVD